MLRTGASRNAPVDDRQRALGKPRVGCRPVPSRTAPGRDWSRRDSARTGVWIGGCKGERDEQGDEDRVGRRRRGVDAGGPAPRLSFDRRPTPRTRRPGSGTDAAVTTRERAGGKPRQHPLMPHLPGSARREGSRCARTHPAGRGSEGGRRLAEPWEPAARRTASSGQTEPHEVTLRGSSGCQARHPAA